MSNRNQLDPRESGNTGINPNINGNHKNWLSIIKKFILFVGPGVMVSVSYMDPGNTSMNVSSGAQYGYKLLFAIFFSNIFAIILQCLCVKLGIVTGKDLAENCREHLPRKLNYFIYVFAELAIIATDLAEVVGTAVALKILFNIPLNIGVLLTVLDVLIILLFYRPEKHSMKNIRGFEIFVSILVAGTIFCFILELFKIQIKSKLKLFEGFLPSTVIFKETQAMYLSIGIVGATVMPHSLYLGSSLVKSRLNDFDLKKYGKIKSKPSLSAINYTLGYSYAELIFTLFFVATFVNSAILIIAGATLYGQPDADDADLLTIYDLLCQYITPAAGLIFALAMLFSGQSAGIICTMSGQIVSEGFLNWSIAPWMRRLITRMLAVIPCFFVTIFFGEKGVSGILNLSQVILSFMLPVVSAPLIYFTSSKKYMLVEKDVDETLASQEHELPTELTPLNNKYVDFSNSKLMRYTGFSVWLFIGSLNLYMVISYLLGADIHF
ncbi:putative divalent metal ion transporter SMF3 SCDLUD_002424 [Saccharomycodes ludwigii]|uniref:putative divalent metal ion transporter SMF3 n=1 Tax=Saccharomycodes ludwigii TaxID=36035 RepID=UPI001E899436|nr:hypothetical protein SCDLUD_002424 [Saccharomycodes ludwigii]KAH3900962.1 hypothetical protein SCDLUD_002424 [Saccharomycodes ludwigii]